MVSGAQSSKLLASPFTNSGKAMRNDQALQLAQVLATLALVDVLKA